MKFHRVLLFTSIQMDITPVGEDLHVLLTSTDAPFIGCTAYAWPGDRISAQANSDGDQPLPDPDITVISSDENPEKYFTIYVADQLARKTGKNVLCTGGIFVDEPDDHQIMKLYENIDEMILDWTQFLTD